MRYINQLQADNAAQAAELERLNQALADLRSYMLCSKFHVDTTVQVNDILHWISATRLGRVD